MERNISSYVQIALKNISQAKGAWSEADERMRNLKCSGPHREREKARIAKDAGGLAMRYIDVADAVLKQCL